MNACSWRQIESRLRPILVELLAAELEPAGRPPIYLIPSSRLRVAFHGNCGGITSPFMSSVLRPFIDDWSGPGLTTILNDTPMVGSDESTRFRDLAIVAIHESIHWLADYPNWITEPPALKCSNADSTQIMQAALLESLSEDPAQWATNLEKPRWFAHDDRFIRMAIHAAYRFHKSSGLSVPPNVLADFEGYGYRAWDYISALEDEAISLIDVPLSQLDQIPNEIFAALWRRDTTGDQTK